MLLLRPTPKHDLDRYLPYLGLLDLQRYDDMARVVCFAHCYRRTRHTHVEFALLRLVRMAMAGEYPPPVRMAVANLRRCLPHDSIDAPIAPAQTLHSDWYHIPHLNPIANCNWRPVA